MSYLRLWSLFCLLALVSGCQSLPMAPVVSAPPKAVIPMVTPATEVEPTEPGLPDAAQVFIEPGWNLLAFAVGELNADGRRDCALVLEEADATKIKFTDVYTFKKANFNLRRLVVLLAEPGKFSKVFESTTTIPIASEERDPYRNDYFKSIAIKQGLLVVSYNYSTSFGSWWQGDADYKFRYESGRLRLVGNEDYTYHAGTGEGYRTSINHLTGQKKRSTVNEVPAPDDFRPKVEWSKFKPWSPLYLDEIIELWDFHNSHPL
jgi:hypothetical protein